jgi:MSHA biogenesis protein MshK
MDETVKTGRIAFAAAVLLLLLLLLAHAGAQAQGLRDPTRPPAQLLSGGADAPAASGAPQLQSVLIGRAPGGRRVAVIDGETVRLGESFRGARLVRMTQDEVELARGRERQVLKLNAPPAPPAGSSVKH